MCGYQHLGMMDVHNGCSKIWNHRHGERLHTLLADLKSCSLRKDLQWGRQIHMRAVRHVSNMYVATALIRMYAKCGSMVDARRIFESVQNPDVVCWTALLLGYTDNGNGLATLELFSRMKASGCAPDSVTYLAALKACTSLALNTDVDGQGKWLNRGREIHSEISCDLSISLQSTLVDMYGKCGSMEDARRVFDNITAPDVVSWNALLLGYVEKGDGLTVLDLFLKMKARGYSPDSVTYIAALKACTNLAGKRDVGRQQECLKRGRELHSEIGRGLNILVQNTLIDMYAKCGSMIDARSVFESIQKPSVVSWTALLLGYAENNDALATLELFSKMKACRCAPDSVTYISALKACTTLAAKQDSGSKSEWLKQGREIHSQISCRLDMFLLNTLIDMYSKCRSMVEARRLFDSIQKPDVVSWNALLLGYVQDGDCLGTLDLFSKMKAAGCAPDSVTYIAALKACTSLVEPLGQGECLQRGKEIHAEIGCNLDIFVQNTLIDMYANCGSMVDAHRVFDSIRKSDVVSWNILLMGYADNGDGITALDLFSKMKALCQCVPDSVTYVAALKACGLTGALTLGRELHLEIGEFTAHVVTCLVDFYAKCGSMAEASEVFNSHSSLRTVPTWNSMLVGYGSSGDTASVFYLFEAMQDQGFQPDAVTFVSILSCCSHAGLVEKAREYFETMPMHYGVTPTVKHYTCMVDVLGRANQLNEAITMLRKMPFTPDAVTWMTLLAACCKWKNVEIGRCAFQSLVDMDVNNTFAYVLMAHIYGGRSMWEEQERVKLEAQSGRKRRYKVMMN